MKSIPLKNINKKVIAYTLVDDVDYDELSKLKWAKDTYGYAVNCQYIGNYRSKSIKMHRVITNAPQGLDVDHINRDKLDNRRSNLRICTRTQNNINQPARANNTSGYKGIGWDKERSKWKAQIKIKGKTKAIGRYKSLEDAREAYLTVAKEVYGNYLPRDIYA
jgi:hypothetical protein